MKLFLSALLALTLTACTTTKIDPVTGQPVTAYDPVKTADVKAALEVPVKSVIRRIIKNSPQHSAEIAAYFRGCGLVLCNMAESGQVDPTSFVAGLERVLPTGLGESAQEAIDAKNVLVALYKTYWNDRFRAELPPDQWPYHVADFFCTAIDGALKDAGQPGVK